MIGRGCTRNRDLLRRASRESRRPPLDQNVLDLRLFDEGRRDAHAIMRVNAR